MTRYAVTGTTEPPFDSSRIIEGALRALRYVSEFHTGCAYGVDTYAAETARLLFPDAEHHLWVPIRAYHNTSLSWKAGYRFHAVKGGYMKRNDALVATCDVLLAFPKTAVEELRSGTWATVRRARKAGREVRIFPLDGSGQQIEQKR